MAALHEKEREQAALLSARAANEHAEELSSVHAQLAYVQRAFDTQQMTREKNEILPLSAPT